MTPRESRPVSRFRAAPSRQPLRSDETRPLPVNSTSSLATIGDFIKQVLRARKNLKTRKYPDEDDDDPD
jgi:hypothetical protein